MVGNVAHEQEAATAYRRHHQQRGGTLRTGTHVAYGQREDGGEHDGLKEIVEYQCHQRHGTQIEHRHYHAGHGAHGTPEEHHLGPDRAHHPTAHEAAHHEDDQCQRHHARGVELRHPPRTRDEVHEIAVDGYLGHLVGQQCQQSEHEPAIAQHGPVGSMGPIRLMGLMNHFRQLHSREDQGYQQHQDAHDAVGHGHIARAALLEQELAYQQRRHEAAHAVERLRQVQSARCRLLRAQLGDVGVGRRLQERQAAAYDEQRSEEGIERVARYEGQGTQSEERQSEDDAAAVAIAVDEDAGGDGHQEIAQIGGHLY